MIFMGSLIVGMVYLSLFRLLINKKRYDKN